jgi:hypothetical protein
MSTEEVPCHIFSSAICRLSTLAAGAAEMSAACRQTWKEIVTGAAQTVSQEKLRFSKDGLRDFEAPFRTDSAVFGRCVLLQDVPVGRRWWECGYPIKLRLIRGRGELTVT